MNEMPLISIGMPVYNEARFIQQTLESILSQDYENFELIISDNASQDDTGSICQYYATKDKRIRYFRNPTNIGAENGLRVFELAQEGEYYVFIGGHDLWHPNFLSHCLSEITRYDSNVLAFPQTVWIDTNNQSLGLIPGSAIDTVGLDPISRLHVSFWGIYYCFPMYGLFKSNALRQLTCLGVKVIAPDNILLAELSLLGTFSHLKEPLLYLRKLDDYGSMESYVAKLFTRSLADLSANELHLQMISQFVNVVSKYLHLHNVKDKEIIITSLVSGLLVKFAWILPSLIRGSSKPHDEKNELATHLLPYFQKITAVVNLHLDDTNPYSNPTPYAKSEKEFLVVIDGVFFQLNNTGIARIWKTLFEEWANDGFAKHIVVLDRAGTSPKISGVRYITVPPYDYNNTDADRVMLQKICDAEKADLFISTYYTTPLSTPSVFMAYDMVPEMTGANLAGQMWKEKHYGIYHACSYIAISGNTAKDLTKFFPYISKELVTIAYCGIERNFSPVYPDEMNLFKTRYGISKPYFLLVGERLGVNGYKNAILFFKAFSILDNKHGFEIVCAGGTNSLEPEFVPYASGVKVHLLKLSDNELRSAYSGAVSLVYPSKYEGFGLPIAEAMACGCPIITCRNASIPEVAGNAVIYVNDSEPNELVNALKFVQIPQNRNPLIVAGFEQAMKFSWRKMADIVSSTLFSISEKISVGKIQKEPLYISHLKQDITNYRQNPSEPRGVESLRQERRRIAEMLLNTPTEKIAGWYQTYLGDAYNLLLTSGLQTTQPTVEDEAIIAKTIPSIQSCGIESILTTAYRPLMERNVPLIGSERLFISNLFSTLQNGNHSSHLLQFVLAALLFLTLDIRK
jgi:glycosyltransferase involved in cell wall biosynthesis